LAAAAVRAWSGPESGAATPGRATGDVGAEARALLDGTAGLGLLVPGVPLPSWAWLNALAHRPPERLYEVLEMAVGPGDDRWATAVTAIAERLGALDPRRATEIQAALLVPWELEALTRDRRFVDPEVVIADFEQRLGA
jgi:hypothetical protein